MSARDNEWRATARMLGRNREWTHASGVVVRHCGHPTAIRPYFVVGQLNELGTFRLLTQAQAAALREGA